MFRSNMALCCLMLSLQASAASPPSATFDWAGTVLNNAGNRDGTVLPDGGVVGAFVDWGSFSPGQPFTFVLAKWDRQGEPVWGGQQTLPNIQKLAASDDGHIFVAGYWLSFHGRLEDYFDGIGLPYTGSGNAYVARVLPSGELDWIRLLGGTTTTAATSIAVDDEGHYYVGGSYAGTGIRIGQETLPATAGASAHHFFVARFSPDGEAAWVRVGIGDYEHVTSTRLALDGSGHVYFGSSPWDSPYVFDHVSVPGRGPFIVKFNPSGEALWALHPSSAFSTEVFAVDLVGNVFMAYDSSQALRLDKYAPDRTLLWRKEIRKYDWSGSGPGITSLAVDAEGHCLVGGTFPRGTLLLGDTSLSTLAVSDVFLAKYSPDGHLRWALNSEGTEPAWVGDVPPRYSQTSGFIVSGTSGDLWVIAGVKGTVRFGQTTIRGPGTDDQDAGFAVLARVEDPEANRPRLALRPTTDGLEASWPAGAVGFMLETTDRLDPTAWTAVPGTPTTEGNQQVVRVTAEESTRFFRLRKP